MLKKTHIAMLVAGALFAAQTGVSLAHSDDAAWLDESSSSAGSQQLTVFNPDGSSYSIIPVDIQLATVEPLYAADESLSQDVMIASNDDDFVVMTEPVAIVALQENVSIHPWRIATLVQ